MPILGGPLLPAAAMVFGERAEPRKLRERFALLGAIAIEARGVADPLPEHSERGHFQVEDSVAIDAPFMVQRPACLRVVLQIERGFGGSGYLLDAQVQQIAVAAAARKVRT